MTSFSRTTKSLAVLSMLILGGCLSKADPATKKGEIATAEPATKNENEAKTANKAGAATQIKIVDKEKEVKTFKFEQIKGAYTCRRPKPYGTARRKLDCGTLHLVDIDLKKKVIQGYRIWMGRKTALKIEYLIEGPNLIGSLPDGKFSIAFGDVLPAMELVHFSEIDQQVSTKAFFTQAKDEEDDLERKVFVYDAKATFRTKVGELYGDQPGQIEVLSDGVLPNASIKELTEKDVENLTRIDLEVLRNAIYARHGQSFKEQRIYYYFLKTPSYVPTFTAKEVQTKLSALEKKNEKLILRYERNAKRFYKAFTR